MIARRRTVLRTTAYLLLGPVAGLSLLIVGLFLAMTGPPRLTNWLAVPGYVGLCLATLGPPRWRSARTAVTGVLLLLGLAAFAPFLSLALLNLVVRPSSLLEFVIGVSLLGPLGIAVHFLCMTALVAGSAYRRTRHPAPHRPSCRPTREIRRDGSKT